MSHSNRKRGHEILVGLSSGSDDTTGEISRKLRALYDSVEHEAIPDQFLDLLEKLDEVEKSAQSTTRKRDE